jgi:large subunit ribosomal protein L6
MVPAGVKVDVDGLKVSVKGPNGQLEKQFISGVAIKLENNQVVVSRVNDEPTIKALHGTTRALIQSMVTGVSSGFTKVLEIEGVGYRAEVENGVLTLYVGYSHPVPFPPPAGIKFEADTRTRQIKVMGADKELVGQTAANIREIRPPEPYKGKGIHYLGERIRRKAGKSGKAKGKK